MIRFTTILMFFFPTLLIGQIRIYGELRDSVSLLPISGALVRLENSNCSDWTNSQGKFDFTCDVDLPQLNIVAEALNYEKQQIIITKTKNQTEIFVQIKMTFEEVILPGVEISNTPTVVWKDETFNVGDIAFHGSNILLLVYDHEERWKRQEESKTTLYAGCQLILLDENEKEIFRKTVPEVSIGFYTGFPHDIFLICRYHRYFVHITDDTIELLQISEEDFSGSVKPVVAHKGNMLCVSNYEENFPEFGYSLLDRNNEQYTPLRTIVHEHQMEMFRSEYKYLPPRDKLEAFRFEVNTGIDKEIIAGYMTGYANSIYYEPINAPLFDQGDSLHIFDHVHGRIYTHNWEGNALDSIPVTYHNPKKPDHWGKKILQDEVRGTYYTTITRHGRTFISSIQLSDGKLNITKELFYRYIDKISVRNNQIYYIYRPFESSQNRFLYKELMPSE